MSMYIYGYIILVGLLPCMGLQCPGPLRPTGIGAVRPLYTWHTASNTSTTHSASTSVVCLTNDCPEDGNHVEYHLHQKPKLNKPQKPDANQTPKIEGVSIAVN